jgi:hypothetical protein
MMVPNQFFSPMAKSLLVAWVAGANTPFCVESVSTIGIKKYASL